MKFTRVMDFVFLVCILLFMIIQQRTINRLERNVQNLQKHYSQTLDTLEAYWRSKQ